MYLTSERVLKLKVMESANTFLGSPSRGTSCQTGSNAEINIETAQNTENYNVSPPLNVIPTNPTFVDVLNWLTENNIGN